MRTKSHANRTSEMIQFELRDPAGQDAEVCRRYWALRDRPTVLKPWRYTIPQLVRELGLTPGQIRAVVESNSCAYDLERRCPRCGRPHLFYNRSDFQERPRGAAECRECVAPRADAYAADVARIHRNMAAENPGDTFVAAQVRYDESRASQREAKQTRRFGPSVWGTEK